MVFALRTSHVPQAGATRAHARGVTAKAVGCGEWASFSFEQIREAPLQIRDGKPSDYPGSHYYNPGE